jgi:hypothetical protein
MLPYTLDGGIHLDRCGHLEQRWRIDPHPEKGQRRGKQEGKFPWRLAGRRTFDPREGMTEIGKHRPVTMKYRAQQEPVEIVFEYE